MKKTSIGGMALIEGIMMKGPSKIAIAIRKPDKAIAIEKYEDNPWFKKYKLDKLAFLRGIFAFADSMITGIKSLNICTKYIDFEDEQDSSNKSKDDNKKKQEGFSNFTMGLIIAFSLLFSIGVFFVLPNVITNFIFPVTDPGNRIWYNLLESALKIAVFIFYIVLITRMEDIKRVFMYHGAEHKTIATYEAGDELTIENVRKHTRFHPRCGTSFMLLVVLISIIFFFFIWFPNFELKLIVKLLCLPIIAGISYEAIKITSNHTDKLWAKIIMYPGLLMQRLTTKEPDDDQIEVAIAAFNEVLDEKLTIAEEIEKETKRLETKGVENAKYECEILMCFTLHINRSQLILKKYEMLDNENRIVYEGYTNMRMKNMPLNYITQEKELYKLRFKVNPAVLIPRNDTEICIEEAINIIKEENLKNALDICTGSGCIGICIAKNTDCKVIATDIATDALDIAKENAKLNEVGTKIEYIQSDMFNNIDISNKFDLIISNPPYITSKVIESLDDEVKKEPYIALNGGEDGLEFYRVIIDKSREYLNNNGYLVLEIGYDQKDDVFQIIDSYNEYKDKRCIKDIGKNDRVIVCRFQKI